MSIETAVDHPSPLNTTLIEPLKQFDLTHQVSREPTDPESQPNAPKSERKKTTERTQLRGEKPIGGTAPGDGPSLRADKDCMKCRQSRDKTLARLVNTIDRNSNPKDVPTTSCKVF